MMGNLAAMLDDIAATGVDMSDLDTVIDKADELDYGYVSAWIANNPESYLAQTVDWWGDVTAGFDDDEDDEEDF